MAGLFGLVFLVTGLWSMAPPVLIWTHLAGTEVRVQDTEQVHTPRSGLVCKGWVLPPGVASPVPQPNDRLMWEPTTTAPDHAESRYVRVRAGQCADGDYWAQPAGDDVVWNGSPDFSTLEEVGLRGLVVCAGGALLRATYRASRRALRDGPERRRSQSTA